MLKDLLNSKKFTLEEEKILKKLSAKPGNKGEINCKFSCSENSEELTLRFTAKREDNGNFNPDLKFSTAKSGSEKHTITGLKSGSIYSIYAYLSNPEFSDWININKTVTAISKAG